MALRLGPLRLPWPKSAADDDPYWESFLNRPAADHRNMVVEIMRRASEGNIFPVRADLHTPEVTARHLKELALYCGADLVGIVDLSRQDPEVARGYPFAVVCAVQAAYDPGQHGGFGGQAASQNGLYVTFVVSAYMRELGYRATAEPDPAADGLAAAAGLGTLNAAGRLVAPKFGTKVHVANIIRTDLPLVADG
jgi:hypothetical protein